MRFSVLVLGLLASGTYAFPRVLEVCRGVSLNTATRESWNAILSAQPMSFREIPHAMPPLLLEIPQLAALVCRVIAV
jgi:hypothetical protein